ncbi:MAG TPA: hypothetical protein VGN95_20695 [Pyrinomonadaceae bacterium]|jgi:hypothetical protein|nr:hypothetical protein [Pyrinomonadaceae bacterium]
MATEFNGYIQRRPGDLLTAEDWNEIQRKIKEDIGKQIKEAVEKINHVPLADSAHKLDDQTSDELAKAILEQARHELPKRTGYRRIFKRLTLGKESIIKHDLGGYPLVDIYSLYPFDVVCSEDDQKNQEQAFFFLYHSSEKRIRFTPVGQTASQGPGVEIETSGGTPFRISFADMLAYYNVAYRDSSTLEDLETEFWDAFLVEPNDDFDDAERCHSPWFDRCCGERRTVAELKSRGDWDELWFKVIPRKTVNRTDVPSKLNLAAVRDTATDTAADAATDANRIAGTPLQPGTAPPAGRDQVAPKNLEVVHFDFNRVGITYLPQPGDPYPPVGDIQRVMVLLKV